MSILIWKDGQQLGPFTHSQILEQLRSGKLSPKDFAWTEGYADWLPLSEIVRIDSQPPAPPPTPRISADKSESVAAKNPSTVSGTFKNAVLEGSAAIASLARKQGYWKKLQSIDLKWALLIIGGLVTLAFVFIGFAVVSSLLNQWEMDRQKERIKTQFDAYQAGASKLMEAIRRNQAADAAASAAFAEQQRQTQRSRDEAQRQQDALMAEKLRREQQAQEEEQSRIKQKAVEQQNRANEIQQREQAAAEARQKARREQLARNAPPASCPVPSAPDQSKGQSVAAPEIRLTAIPLGKWTREENNRVISTDGSRTILVLPEGSRVRAWVDGHPGPVCRNVVWNLDQTRGLQPSLPISPDFKRIAYLAPVDGGGVKVVADSTESPVYKEIKWIGFGPAGHHLAYLVNVPDEDPSMRHNRMFVGDNGIAGPLFSRIDPNSITFSADGQHLAYVGQIDPPEINGLLSNRSQQYCVVLDGKEQNHYGYIQGVRLSPNGSHCGYLASQRFGTPRRAIIDGVSSRTYESVAGLFMSDDGSRTTFVVRENQSAQTRAFVVDGDREGPAFVAIGEVAISENGSRLAYVGQKPAGAHTDAVVVDNGEIGPAYDRCSQLQISPNGKTLSYVATVGQRTVLVVNSSEFGPLYSLNTKVAFSPDGNHWACGVQDDNQHFVVLLDGIRKPSVAMNRGDSLSFDADGKRLMLLTQREGNKVQVDCFTGSSGETVLRSGDGKHTAFVSPFGGGGAHVIVDGIEGPGFRAIHDLAMSPDGQHVAYVTEEPPNSCFVVVDGMKGPPFESILRASPDGSAISFKPDGALTFLAVTDGKLCRCSYSAAALKAVPSIAYIDTVTPNFRNLCSINDPQQLRPALAEGPNGTFFGITRTGGQYGKGSLFSCTDSGTEAKILHSFYGGANDGELPSSLISTPNGEIYGTTESSTIFHFSIRTNEYKSIKIAENLGPLVGVLEDGSLFGHASTAVFTMKADATNLQMAQHNLAIRSAVIGPDGAIYCVTNDAVTRQSTIQASPVVLHRFVRSPEDGSDPGPLIVFDSAGNIFGYTNQGGANDHGVIYGIDADGTSYIVIAHLSPTQRVTGLVAGEPGMLYGLFESESRTGNGFFSVPCKGGNPVILAAHTEIRGENPMIYRDSVLYGCGVNSIYRLQIPRNSPVAQPVPTVTVSETLPPPLTAFPIVFTNPDGQSSYHDVVEPDEQDGRMGATDQFAPGSANQNRVADPYRFDVGRRPPSPIDEAPPVILKVDQALNDHDWSAFSAYIGNGTIDYFGHRNASASFIRGDMQQDARTYKWTRTYPIRSTFRQYEKQGLIYESVQEQTEALEFNGKHHQANCLLQVSYEPGNPPRLVSVSLKVLR